MKGRERIVDYRDSSHCKLVQSTFQFIFLFPIFIFIYSIEI
jgi:hypothetical protein